MTEPSWTPLFRASASTVTKALRSHAFAASRERAVVIITDPEALRDLADVVETLPHENAPLSGITDRVAAAVRFLRAKAEELDSSAGTRTDTASPSPPVVAPERSDNNSTPPVAVVEAHERLLVAALHYLVTPVDLVPDFRAGGYIDDVLLLSWVFGSAGQELEPFLDDAALPDPDPSDTTGA